MGAGRASSVERQGGCPWPHAALCGAVLAAVAWLGLCEPYPGDAVELPGGTWIESASNVKKRGNYLCATLQRKDKTTVEDCALNTVGYEFENIDGQLQADDRMDALPAGTWDETAENVSFVGNLLCAYLRSDVMDGTIRMFDWTYTCVETIPGFSYDNVDGQFRVRTSACDTLPACPHGWALLKSGLSDLYCKTLYCDPVRDVDICCERAMPCSNISGCEHSYVQDPNGYCGGEFCTEEDVAHCCIKAATCASMQCPFGFTHLPNATNLYCPDDICNVQRDYLDCCWDAAPCGELNDTDCPTGFRFNSSDYCDGPSCEEARDRMVCCQVVEACSVVECPFGYLLKPIQADGGPYCFDDPCALPRDLHECCHPSAPCGNLTCPWGRTHRDGELYCQHYVFDGCTLEDDTDTCCRGAAPCSDLLQDNESDFSWEDCPHGEYFNSSDYCDGSECNLTRDAPVCCQPAEPCTEYGVCPIYEAEGYVLLPNPGDTYCNGMPCDYTRDRDFCCELRAPCAELECPYGYVHRPSTYETADGLTLGRFCHAPSCDVAVDNHTCCEDAGQCDSNYTCPFGYSDKPGMYCGAAICDDVDDLDSCCDPSMPCTNLTCPWEYGYVNNPHLYCKETYCEYDVDANTCCLRGIRFRYYRFFWEDTRQDCNIEICEPATEVSFAEIYISYQGLNVDLTHAVVDASPDADYPHNEYPALIVDGNMNTKFLDFAATYLDISFPEDTEVDSWKYQTANDFPTRDPVSWYVEASRDNSFWVKIQHVADVSAQVPESRFTWTGLFYFDVPCKSPNFVDDSCAEGPWVEHGGQCTANCTDGGTPSVDVLSCDQGFLTPSFFECS